MKRKIIKIGNSKGITLPADILAEKEIGQWFEFHTSPNEERESYNPVITKLDLEDILTRLEHIEASLEIIKEDILSLNQP